MSKKKYTKPEVNRVEVDNQVIRMFTSQGFLEVFYEELQSQRKINPKISEKLVFDSLNKRFYDVFNEFRYSDYNAFKRRKKTYQQRLNK